MPIIEGIVQQKHAADFQTEGKKLSPQLGERVRTQATGDQGAQVLAAQVNLHRPRGVQRKRQEANGSELMANRATVRFRARDQRLTFTHGQRFHAIGTERLVGDLIPRALTGGAAAAGSRTDNVFHGCETRAVHVHGFQGCKGCFDGDRGLAEVFIGFTLTASLCQFSKMPTADGGKWSNGGTFPVCSVVRSHCCPSSWEGTQVFAISVPHVVTRRYNNSSVASVFRE
jgi:hypothetical protein